jgi:microcystin-dependent protein
MAAEPFLSELKIFAFGFAPKGWAQCNGQLLPINQNQALFALLGTTYGGDGRVTFALPELRGRVPMHVGDGFSLGQRGGEEFHTLNINELPTHTHSVRASDNGPTVAPPTNNFWASNTGFTPYGSIADAGTAMSPQSIGNIGGSQPHENRSPYLTLNYCIALQGIFPSPN